MSNKYDWEKDDIEMLAKAQPPGWPEWIERDEEVATERAETDPCERGTPGCSVRHTRDSECQTW